MSSICDHHDDLPTLEAILPGGCRGCKLQPWACHLAGKRLGNGRFDDLARKMPYFSSALMGLVGMLMGMQAWLQIAAS